VDLPGTQASQTTFVLYSDFEKMKAEALFALKLRERLREFYSVTPISNPLTQLRRGVHERAGPEQASPFIVSHRAVHCYRDDAFTDF
jgi:hypothetical protein